jgi:hypothetical protein
MRRVAAVLIESTLDNRADVAEAVVAATVVSAPMASAFSVDLAARM